MISYIDDTLVQNGIQWAIRLLYLLVFYLLLSPIIVLGQELEKSENEVFIEDYTDELLLRIYTITKSNSLSIENPVLGKSLNLLPNGQTSLGLGFNYKRLGVGLAFGLPKSSSSNNKYGDTQRIDIQGSIYGSKLGGDGFFQVYKGYYNSNPQDFIEWTNEAYPQLPDMRILSLGVSAFYVFNNEKFSYRAAFIRDQVQKKSAGSFLLGVFGNYDEAKTDNGFIPQEFPDSLRQKIDLKEFTTIALGISIGYAYNFVIKEKFIIGLAALPGFGYQRISITQNDNTEGIENQPAGQLLARSALGYEHKYFYVGLTGSIILRGIEFSPYDFKLATEQFRVIVGKRFSVR